MHTNSDEEHGNEEAVRESGQTLLEVSGFPEHESQNRARHEGSKDGIHPKCQGQSDEHEEEGEREPDTHLVWIVLSEKLLGPFRVPPRDRLHDPQRYQKDNHEYGNGEQFDSPPTLEPHRKDDNRCGCNELSQDTDHHR